MTLNELEIAISVEITKINALDHEGSIASEMSALARVDALEWVLGMIDTTITHAAGTPRLLTTMENSDE